MSALHPLVLSLPLALTLSGPLHATSPIAEVICAPTEDLHGRLKGRMASRQTATGLRGREQVMEVWTDPNGDWTMVVTYTSGTSCIVAMGEAWSQVAEADPA